MKKNKRNKIIGLSIGILIVLIIVISSTYAYWQITRTQETPNDIVAACLNLDLADASAAIDLDSAWPISDAEGKNLTGYTFTVTNNCNEEINYIVGLNRVEESNYLLDSSIKLQLDDNSTHVYGELSDVEYADAENTEYTARVSKQVSVETISGNGTNTHTIRVWINDEAPVTEQSKTFLGQVFITGGQGIEVPVLNKCFAISENGTITDYNYECGTDVKVPAEINGIQVKQIKRESFLTYSNVQEYLLKNEETDEIKYIYYITDETVTNEVIDYLKEDNCSNDLSACDLNAKGISIITNEDDFNNINWNNYSDYSEKDLTIYYYNLESSALEDTYTLVKTLNLNDAIYLENIGEDAFNGAYSGTKSIHENCSANTSGEEYYECSGILTEIIFPENGTLETIESNAFGHNQISQLSLPNSLKNIGGGAFAENELTDLVIPNNVESIGTYAFERNNITNLIFNDTEENPSKLTTIEEGVFESNKLTKVVIPSAVSQIKYRAFTTNSDLKEVIIKNTEGNVTIDNVAFNSSPVITYDPNYTE